MSSESVTEYDLAACQLYISSAERITNLFELMWKQIDSQRQAIGIGNGILKQNCHGRGPFIFDRDGGLIWDWFYLTAPLYRSGNPKNWYIGWGLRFPEQSGWWKNCDPPLPRTAHAFVVWGSESNPPAPKMQKMDLPDDWTAVPDGGAIVGRALKAFDTEEDRFSREVSSWVATKTIAILPFIKDLLDDKSSSQP